MTIRDAKIEVAKLGMVLSKTGFGGEFRVNFKGGDEATAYYTDDLEDAVGTARAMKKQQPQSRRSAAVKWSMKEHTREVEEYARELLKSGYTEDAAASIMYMKYGLVSKRDAVQLVKEAALDLGMRSSSRGAGRRVAEDSGIYPGYQMGEVVDFARDSLRGGERAEVIITNLMKKFFIPYAMALKVVQNAFSESEGRESGRSTRNGESTPKMDKVAVGQALDRISDHLERLGPQMPREAGSILKSMALQLDRVANTLESEKEVTDRVSQIENELDGLGVDFTVGPNSSGKQATCIYAYKGQLNSPDEAAVLGRIAKKHGSLFENGNPRAYKITIPHPVRV